MARKTLRGWTEKTLGTEWDRLLRRIERSPKRRVLLCWNRGLGDVALGLHAVVHALKRAIPDASLTILTRPDLADAFALLPIDELIVDPSLVRNHAVDVARALAHVELDRSGYDVVVSRPDPTHWFRGRTPAHPRLAWPMYGDLFARPFETGFGIQDDSVCIGVHLQSETARYYRYAKDWPIDAWRALFERVAEHRRVRFVLFGHRATPLFEGPHFLDLRGRTSLLEMLAVIRKHCRILVAPDSGVLTMAYYLDVQQPLDIVSLWADPRQGILKAGAPSPNAHLRHRVLLAPDERIDRLSVDAVEAAVHAAIDAALDESFTDPPRDPARALSTRSSIAAR